MFLIQFACLDIEITFVHLCVCFSRNLPVQILCAFVSAWSLSHLLLSFVCLICLLWFVYFCWLILCCFLLLVCFFQIFLLNFYRQFRVNLGKWFIWVNLFHFLFSILFMFLLAIMVSMRFPGLALFCNILISY